MSNRRPGTCREPGPRTAHCTDSAGPGHRYACYDAGEDVSWVPDDLDVPHDCGDPYCPDNPKPASCTATADCVADVHTLCCPSTHRAVPREPTFADAPPVDPPVEPVQVWERPVVPGTDPRRDPVAARLHLEVDDEGPVRVHEAVLAQLLSDAGWERIA